MMYRWCQSWIICLSCRFWPMSGKAKVPAHNLFHDLHPPTTPPHSPFFSSPFPTLMIFLQCDTVYFFKDLLNFFTSSLLDYMGYMLLVFGSPTPLLLMLTHANTVTVHTSFVYCFISVYSFYSHPKWPIPVQISVCSTSSLCYLQD